MIKVISKKEAVAKKSTAKYDIRLFMKSNKEIVTPVFAVSAETWKKYDLDNNSIHIGIDEETNKSYLIVVEGNEGRLLKAPKERGSKKSSHFTYRKLSDAIEPNLTVGDSIPLFLIPSIDTVDGALLVLEISKVATTQATTVAETGSVIQDTNSTPIMSATPTFSAQEDSLDEIVDVKNEDEDEDEDNI